MQGKMIMERGQRSIVVIKPNRSWFYFDLKGIIQCRDLLFLLAWRNYVAKFKQTILGPIWYVIQPLLTSFVYVVVFNRVAKISTDGLPPVLFYLCGLLIWNYFALTFSRNASSLKNNQKIFSKVYFPRIIVPLAYLISHLVEFFISLVTFVAILLYYKYFTEAGAAIRPGWMLGLLPLLLIQTACLSLGLSLWMSALTAKYRDFSFLNGFILQLWRYITPVIYPLSMVPQEWRATVAANPMVAIVEIFKKAFLGAGVVDSKFIITSVITTILVLLSGMVVFNRVERTYIDTV